MADGSIPINVRELVIGHSYENRRPEAALMPALDFANYTPLLGPMKRLAVGDKFRITEVRMKGGNPWYAVEVLSGRHAGARGWINSIGLLPGGVREHAP